jgi:peptidoglycan/LPS O-acetylase OafA/YrhL
MERNELYSVFRFIFCFGIVLYHYGPRNFVSAHKWLSSGAIYVTFFFVLSGFMAAISASKAKEFNPFDFIARRLSKLLPLYYLALALFIPLQISNIDLLALSLNLILMQSWIPPFPLMLNFPAWFVSCLFSHLLLFPIIFKHAQQHKIRPSIFLLQALGFWAATQVILTILFNSPSFYKGFLPLSHDLIFYSPISHLCSFSLGVGLGILYVQSPQIRLAKWTSLSLSGTITFLILGALQFEWVTGVFPNLPLGASFFAPAFGALVFSIALLPKDARELFNHRLVHYLGEISFPIYLLQHPVRIIAGYVFPFAGTRIIDMQVFLFYFGILMLMASLYQSLVQDKARRLIIAGLGMAKEGSKQFGRRRATLQGGQGKKGLR